MSKKKPEDLAALLKEAADLVTELRFADPDAKSMRRRLLAMHDEVPKIIDALRKANNALGICSCTSWGEGAREIEREQSEATKAVDQALDMLGVKMSDEVAE